MRYNSSVADDLAGNKPPKNQHEGRRGQESERQGGALCSSFVFAFPASRKEDNVYSSTGRLHRVHTGLMVPQADERARFLPNRAYELAGPPIDQRISASRAGGETNCSVRRPGYFGTGGPPRMSSLGWLTMIVGHCGELAGY